MTYIFLINLTLIKPDIKMRTDGLRFNQYTISTVDHFKFIIISINVLIFGGKMLGKKRCEWL